MQNDAICIVLPIPPVIEVAAIDFLNAREVVDKEGLGAVGRSGVDHVPTGATMNGVVAAAELVERIVAVAANQAVVACAADDAVVARAAIDRVVSHACIHGIITRTG